MPTRAKWSADNQPLVLLDEAMASRVPVVIANRGGTAQMVKHELTALLAPPTAEGATSAVPRLLGDNKLWTRLAIAAEEAVRALFHSTAITADVEARHVRLLADASR